MKKTFYLIIPIFLFFCSVSSASQPTCVTGDVNCDGSVNISDVQICINVILGVDIDTNHKTRCDVMDPGLNPPTINILDIQRIMNMVLGIIIPSGNSYSLNLSGVTTRQHMQDWDPNWISEIEDGYGGYEFQVDPVNGGQVGIWGGYGNPPSAGSNKDYSQFIAAGPPAGAPVRVRMKFEHRDDGTWASCSHKTDNEALGRAHYEVALQAGSFRIYKYWGPDLASDTYATIASTAFSPTQGKIYWIYLTERRAGNSVNGTLTLSGELLDQNLNRLATVSVVDDGNLSGITNPLGKPVIPSSNKRGFGSYSAPDGAGAKILEWHVEDAPSSSTTTASPVSSTTTTTGHHGGGGGGGNTTTTSTLQVISTTTTVKVTSTTTSSIQPECINDADCDDGVFCNGEEKCSIGICVAGQNPCSQGQVCRGETDTCWDTVNINASSMKNTLSRPILRDKKCLWLIVYAAGDHHFTRDVSSIEVAGPEAGAQGVAIDIRRKAIGIGRLIFVPICIEQEATVGQWSIQIKTDIASASLEETIVTSFQVK